MRIDKLDLLGKGWSASEIENASRIIQKAEDRRHIGLKFLDRTIYWALLFLLVVGNAVCSAFLIPFLFAVKGSIIVLIVAVLGLAFGVFFSIIIADIQKAHHQHLQSLLISLVISGIINFALMSSFSIRFSTVTGLPLRHSPYLIAGIYLFAYLMPHAILTIEQYRKD